MTQFNTLSEYVESLTTNEQKVIQEYKKFYTRFYRHQDININNNVGRPKKSIEEKLENQKAYREKKRQVKIANGTYRPRGRPKKVKVEAKKEDMLT